MLTLQWGVRGQILHSLAGRRQVLRCLLELHALCREEDPWFLLNDLYLTDYCVWIQKAR